MPTLRELLDKRKNENAKPVLQPQAKQTLPEKATQAEGTIQSNQAGSIDENSQRAPSENNSVLGTERPGEIAATAPPGLTTLQLIRWKKENAAKVSNVPAEIVQEIKQVLPVSVEPSSVPLASARPTVQNEEPVREISPPPGLTGLQLLQWKKKHGSAKVEETRTPEASKDAQDSPGTGAEISDGKSASRSADAQKTNAGKADLETLKQNLIYLANNIEQKELVAQVVRTIAVQLQNSPELTPHMSNADVNLVVRGLRSSYAIAARKKQETKDAKAKKSSDTSELAALFKDAGLTGLRLN